MIKYNPKAWISLIFHAYSREIYRTLLPNLLFIAVYTALITWVVDGIYHFDIKLNTTVHSLLGFVLGLFLVFRTNTAYDRWWEGRKLWGALVNNCRNLALKIDAFLPEDDVAHRAFFARTISNYPLSMKEHLREGTELSDLDQSDPAFLKEIAEWQHPPNYIASQLYKRLNQLLREGLISGEQLLVLDKEAKAMTDIVGACERIRNTPIPYSYSMYMKKFIFIYIITLPIGFAPVFHWWTIPIVMLIFYILVSTELIAEEIEDPFGRDSNDLDTDGLSVKIRGNVREILLKKTSA